MTTSLPTLPEVAKLSPRVIRILGGNPGKFTLQGTNTYLIGTSTPRLLLDTGEGKPRWSSALSSVLKDEETAISSALITHWHPDHVGGITQLHSLCPSSKIYENDPPDPDKPDDPIINNISNGQTFTVPGATLRAFHCPGHTTNHMAFILLEEDAMFTGDNVLGHGTAVFEDLAAYMASLERMQLHFKGRAYPGHGAVIDDGPAKIREYIAHRKEREEQVLQVLGGGPEEGMTAMAIVEVVYKDYDRGLWGPAEKGVVLILVKLEGEGRVMDVGGGRWRVVRKEEGKL